jgi:hypothetical protein
VRTAKSTKNTLYIDSLCEVGGLICRVRCDFWTLRMSSGGVFKRRRLVCLAGLSGASRNRLVNRLPNQTSVAAATRCLLADQWHVHDWPHNVVALFGQWARIISEHRFCARSRKHATRNHGIASHSVMYNVRDAAFGGYMTRTTQLVCCAVLSVASSLIPLQSKSAK